MLDAALSAEVVVALTGLKDALMCDDPVAVRSGMVALGALSQRLAEAIYQASATEADGGDTGSDDDVDDAEIVDAEVVDEGDDQAAAS
jgi:molecular chaperone DnaK